MRLLSWGGRSKSREMTFSSASYGAAVRATLRAATILVVDINHQPSRLASHRVKCGYPQLSNSVSFNEWFRWFPSSIIMHYLWICFYYVIWTYTVWSGCLCRKVPWLYRLKSFDLPCRSYGWCKSFHGWHLSADMQPPEAQISVDGKNMLEPYGHLTQLAVRIVANYRLGLVDVWW